MSTPVRPGARGRWPSRLAWLAVVVLVCAPAEFAPAQETAEPRAPETLVEVLSRLDKREFDLARALESQRLDLASAERRFAAAQERLDAEPQPGDDLREQVAARRLELAKAQRLVALLEEQRERVAGEKEASRRLHELRTRRVAPETLSDWTTASLRTREELGRQLVLEKTRTEELRQELAFMRERLQQLPAVSGSQRWVSVQAEAIGKLLAQYEEGAANLEQRLALEEQLASALQRETEDLPLSARLRTALHRLRDVWNYQLTGPEAEPITLGKVISAFGIFLIGYFLAAAVARQLGKRVFPRMRLEEGAAHAFQSLIFYLLLLITFLTALRMVQIPLTAFAVVGGALAIGVGFGSQNVVNNFISGLILLVERPIKIGDLIELGGVYGTVERIGLRSTRVRTGDNVHIIVPNASFLENNVINWTHTDARVRISITVGVVYGSPTREAERLVLEAISEQQAVLSVPAPVVLFRDFGDDALIFEMRFWIEMRTMLDRLRIESDVRFRIDDLFREAGIVIAFPQRDVHLDTTAPLEVRMVETPGDTGHGKA